MQDKKAGDLQPTLCQTAASRKDVLWGKSDRTENVCFCGKRHREAFHRAKGWRKRETYTKLSDGKNKIIINLKKNKKLTKKEKTQYTTWRSNKQIYLVIMSVAWQNCTRHQLRYRKSNGVTPVRLTLSTAALAL